MSTTATKPETQKAKRAREQEEAKQHLRKLLPPGSTVYTVLRHVSKSGMTRDIDVYAMKDNEPVWLSGYVARRLGIGNWNDKREAVRVGGCGMDMGYHIAYELSHVLYHDDFTCIGENCPANDHSNGDRDYTPHKHSDGGYALRHRWM